MANASFVKSDNLR